MNEIIVKEVNFNGAQLMAVQDEKTGKIHVGVSWICNGIGLTEGQKDRQVKNIQSDIVLSQGSKKLPVKFDGQVRETLCIELEYMPLWLAKIEITPAMQSEQPEATANLIEYQLKAKDVLANAFLPKHNLPAMITSDFLQQITDSMRDKERQIEELTPKAEFADRLLKSKDSILVREFAKIMYEEKVITFGEKKLYTWFRENGYLMKNNEPYQQYMQYFEVQERPIDTPFGERITHTTKVTPSGQLYFYHKLKNKNINVFEIAEAR